MHIGGAIAAVFTMGAIQLWLIFFENDRRKKKLASEIAAKLGVSVSALEDQKLNARVVHYITEKYSNELFRNRISDLCGVVRATWDWLALIVLLLVLGGVIWSTATETLENAVYAWFAPGLALFFWLTAMAFALCCYVLTGRYPGEAQVARKAMAKHLNQ